MLHSDEVGFQTKIPQNWSAINTSRSPALPVPASLQAADNIMQPEKKKKKKINFQAHLKPSWNQENLQPPKAELYYPNLVSGGGKGLEP